MARWRCCDSHYRHVGLKDKEHRIGQQWKGDVGGIKEKMRREKTRGEDISHAKEEEKINMRVWMN